MVKGGSGKDHMTNQELYGDLPSMRLAGHCMGYPEEIASLLVMWPHTEGRVNKGRKPTGYIDNIKRGTALSSIEYITAAMIDQAVWKRYIKEARSGDRPK